MIHVILLVITVFMADGHVMAQAIPTSDEDFCAQVGTESVEKIKNDPAVAGASWICMDVRTKKETHS